MYIPANNYVSEGLRINYIHSLHNDKAYSIKRLRKIDERLAREYAQTQLYGGSLKSFWNKVVKIGRKVLQAPAQISAKIYPYMRKGIKFLGKNEIAQNLLGAIPKVGPALQEGAKQLDSAMSHVDKILESIRNKNPSVSVKEAKDLINSIQSGVKEVTNKTNISEDEKQRINSNVDKIYNALPSVIKSEGLSAVQQAAGYLPYLDPSTMKVMERTSKSGGALKPRVRFTKPKIITLNKEIFKKLNFPEYKPDVVGNVGGAVYRWKGMKFSPKEGISDEEKAEFEEYHRKKEEERKPLDEKRKGLFNRPENDYKKEKSSGRVKLSGGRSTLAGEDSDADKFIASMRNKLKIKKTK
jgi:hypothetical protein